MELKKKDYNGATYIVEIKSQENHSWQGILTWVNQNQSKPFRSALELIKLMDSGLTDDKQHEE